MSLKLTDLKMEKMYMEFFASAVETLKVLVIAIGAGLGAWGIVNLLEGYVTDTPTAMLMFDKVAENKNKR